MTRSFVWRLAAAACAMAWPAATASAQEWKDLGPAPVSFLGLSAGRISAIVCSPTNADRYYVGGADGGVWRTDDGGVTWVPLTDHMPATAIGALAMHPTDDGVVYAGTGEANFANHSRYGLGIYKTTDSGATWEVLAEETFAGRCFSKLVIDPASPDVMYASVTPAGGFPEMAAAKLHPGRLGRLGVFKSTDAGVTWTHLAGGLPDQAATDLALDPADSSVIYAAIGRIFGSPDNGIYKSIDAGATWTKLASGLPATTVGRISLAVAPSDPQRLYALFTNPATSTGGSATERGAFRSDNGGASWVAIGTGVDQATYGWYLSTVSVRPGFRDTVIMGGFSMSRSTNAGASYSTITPPHVDLHAIAWDAAGRLLAGDDGGVHRSTDLGNNWTALNTGLATLQFYAGLSVHPTDDERVLGGNQDNGSNMRSADTRQWTTVTGGDGGWTQWRSDNPLILFTESQGTGALNRSTNGGMSFSFAGGGISGSDRNCFLPPYVIDPVTPTRMLYATHRIYESVNGGASWSVISGDVTAGIGAVRALAIAPSDPAWVYLATNDGLVRRSTDGGRNFTTLLSGHPGWPRVTRELWVDPRDARTVYLATAVFGADQVRRSTDGGETWQALDAGLPDLPVNTVVADVRARDPVLYAGTDSGLFKSRDNGQTWTRHGSGLPSAAVIDILFEPARDRILVGTQGRGTWSAHIGFCQPDCDGSTGDGVLDFFDFVCFQDSFGLGEAYACDCDLSSGSGVCDFFDFVCFQDAFAAGCP